MITKEKTRCKYVKVADDLYKNMIHGNLTGCEYMRSENALVRYYKVNRKTIRKALDKLETEGAIAPVKNQKRRLLIGDRKNSEFYVGFAVYGNAQKQDIGNQCKASIFDEITFCFQRQHAKTFKILFDKHHPEYIPETLNSEAVDIFIVNSNINLDIIKKLGKNYIIFDPSLDQLDNFTIGFNGTKLGYDAYSYLYQKGHRKIGILKSNVNYFFYGGNFKSI
jgi:DNA-binding LacI/PurR family transcriptional regulator